jgi:hypothetical protein
MSAFLFSIFYTSFKTFGILRPMIAPLKRLTAAALLALSSGCVSIHSGAYPNSSFSETEPADIQVLTDFPPDATTYSVIGEFHTDEGVGDLLTDSLFQRRLRKKAAKIGADAVVLYAEYSKTYEVTRPATSSTQTNYSGTLSGLSTNLPTIPVMSGSSHSTTTYSPASTTAFDAHVGRGYFLKYVRKG